MNMKRSRWKPILGLLILVLAAICIMEQHLIWTVWQNLTQKTIPLAQGDAWAGGKYTRLMYGDDQDQYVDLYVPDSEEKVPLFVLVHGGGFVSGDSQTRQTQFMYRYFRDHGFACASVNYRLAGRAKFPAAIEDVRSAVQYLVRHETEYGYDAEHIAIWGESAGGYLAAYEAITEDQADISALVDYYGVMDFPSMERQFAEQGIPGWILNIGNSWIQKACEGFASCEEYWIGTEKKNWTDELLLRSSVVRMARAKDAGGSLKTLILHGDADITVPYAQSAALAEALETVYGRENVSFQLLHGFNHASELFYTQERLHEVEIFVLEAMGLPVQN